MARFHKMVSMLRTPDEKAEERIRDSYPPPISAMPDVPYGLCISLTQVELEKLDLEEDMDVGDMIHLFAMAKVTSVSKRDTADGCDCRVELSIVSLAVEDESTETAAEPEKK